MKPSWDDAPSWAQWLAVDEDGAWYWYEDEPGYSALKQEWRNDGEFQRAYVYNWMESKESRP